MCVLKTLLLYDGEHFDDIVRMVCLYESTESTFILVSKNQEVEAVVVVGFR